jgi:nitrate/nitrite-specific signal transduction histidine kinase
VEESTDDAAQELELLRARERQASELRDSLAQQLFAIGARAQRWRTTDDPTLLTEALCEVGHIAAAAGREVRDTRIGAAPEPEPRTSFEAALERSVEAIARDARCRIVVTRDGVARRLGADAQTLLLDTAREALRLLAVPGWTRLAVAHIRYGTASVSLSVQAEYLGAGPATDILETLRHRAETLRGTLRTTREARRGAVILDLPLDWQREPPCAL